MPPVAWLDATTGAHDAVGGAAVTSHGDRWELDLGRPAPVPTMRLAEGVVSAAAVQVTGILPTAGGAPAPSGTLIDGIPPEILAASRPSRPTSYDAAPRGRGAAEPRTVPRAAPHPRRAPTTPTTTTAPGRGRPGEHRRRASPATSSSRRPTRCWRCAATPGT